MRSAVGGAMSWPSYNMKFPVSCSHHSASKTPFAFMDFLLVPCVCVSCSCSGEIGSIFIHSPYPFHLQDRLDRGPLEWVPLTPRRFTAGQAGQGTGRSPARLLGAQWIPLMIMLVQRERRFIRTHSLLSLRNTAFSFHYFISFNK